MKLIKTCRDCGYFKYTDPTNTMFHGSAICEFESKALKPPYAFPAWCHLEDTQRLNEVCLHDMVIRYKFLIVRAGWINEHKTVHFDIPTTEQMRAIEND